MLCGPEKAWHRDGKPGEATAVYLENDDPAYFTTARDSPTGWLKERMVDGTVDGEPTFESAALLPPARDYVMVGNVDSHTKFAVSPDGRIKHASSPMF